MKRKLRNIFWLIGLILIGFPIAFIAMLVKRPTQLESEYHIMFIIGGIVFIILLGGISLIVYKILKKKKNADPGKYALLVYSFMMLVFLCHGFWLNDALKRRDQNNFLSAIQDELYVTWTDEVLKREDATENVKKSTEYICTCIYSDLEKNVELVDKFMMADDPFYFAVHDQQIILIMNNCVALYYEELDY